MFTLFFRTVLTYVLLIGSVRLMGKRQIGELEINEFVIAMLLSELAALPIADNTIPLTFSVFPIIVLISIEVAISFFALKNKKLKKIVDGTPSLLINKGRLCKTEMEKVRIGLDELMGQLRLKNVSDISDVEYAVLEENGQVSVVLKSEQRPVTLKDINVNSVEKGMVHTLICDGEISEFNLKLTGHSKKWLLGVLKKNKCSQKDVFILTIDDAENVNLIKNGDIL